MKIERHSRHSSRHQRRYKHTNAGARTRRVRFRFVRSRYFAELFDARFFSENGGFVRRLVTALLWRRKGGASVYDGRRLCEAAQEALGSSLGFPGRWLAAL